MKKIRNISAICVLMFLFICLPALVHAGIDPSCDPQDPACPIDGGLTFLLTCGVIYGIKKVRTSNKKDASAL